MKAVHSHRHSLGHEHEYEPQYGLPEVLPATEKLLWQGSPDWKAIAVEVFHVRKLAIYFAIILALRAGFVLSDGGGLMAVLAGWAWLVPMAAIALGILLVLARLAARTTVYSITDRRVTMRIGIVLTVTFNLPFKRIEGAGLLVRGNDGHGDIPITLHQGEQIAILQLWPHARPWHLKRPQPMLRGLPQVAQVGQVLAQAWSAATGAALAPTPDATPVRPQATAASPALASVIASDLSAHPTLAASRAA